MSVSDEFFLRIKRLKAGERAGVWIVQIDIIGAANVFRAAVAAAVYFYRR